MKRVYVNEEWCLGCHLCEYNCAFANSGMADMATALKGKPIYPRIHIEGNDKISYAVSCRHCTDPICIKSCIAGAIPGNAIQGVAGIAIATLLMPSIKRLNIAPLRDKHSDNKRRNNDK